MAHLAMISEVVRSAGARGGQLAVAILLTNGVFALVLRAFWRIRLVPILAIFTTTAMTEALVWRSAWEGRRTMEIGFAGVASAILLCLFGLIVHWLDRAPRQ
jgi:hypothetical protein